MASKCEPIFCCDSAVPVTNAYTNTKLHNDPNRGLHDAIFRSFIAFAVRRQYSADLMALIQVLVNEGSGKTSPSLGTSSASTKYTPLPPNAVTAPAFEPQSLKDNPLTPDKPYVIHLTSRHDFGPVYSHRYFVCPEDLQDDWIELTLMQWFAQGDPFKLKAEKWDLKCGQDKRFFRLTLRPNLNMRGSLPANSPQPLPAQLAGFQAGGIPTRIDYPNQGLDSRYGSGATSAMSGTGTYGGFQARGFPPPIEGPHMGYDSGYGSAVTTAYGGNQDHNQGDYFRQWRGCESGSECGEPEEIKQE